MSDNNQPDVGPSCEPEGATTTVSYIEVEPNLFLNAVLRRANRE